MIESTNMINIGLLESTFVASAEYSKYWSVAVADRTKTSYGAIRAELNGYPVADMTSTFGDCTSLTTAPVIPSSVTNMDSTFFNCTALTGNIEINANPTNYAECFYGTSKAITITGSCSDETKAALAGTANYGNVTYTATE